MICFGELCFILIPEFWTLRLVLLIARPPSPVSFPSKSGELKASLATIGSANDDGSIPRAMPCDN